MMTCTPLISKSTFIVPFTVYMAFSLYDRVGMNRGFDNTLAMSTEKNTENTSCQRSVIIMVIMVIIMKAREAWMRLSLLAAQSDSTVQGTFTRRQY